MRKFLRVLLAIVISIVISLTLIGSFGVQANLKRENAQLTKEVQTARAEIDRLRNEPQILFSEAWDQMKKGLRYDSALALLKELQQKYPDFQPDRVSTAIGDCTLAKIEYEKGQEERTRIQEEKKRIREEERAKREAEAKQLAEQQRLEKEQKAREKKEAFARAELSLVKSRDEMKGVDWYTTVSTPKTNEKNIHAYIGKKNDSVWLRFKMTYSARDWLFVKSVLFKIDGEDFELHYGLFDDWNRDHSGSGIWEWKDVMVDAYTWRLINRIADSQKAMMRYEGQQYWFDREIDSDEKAALKIIISAFEGMGGQPPTK